MRPNAAAPAASVQPAAPTAPNAQDTIMPFEGQGLQAGTARAVQGDDEFEYAFTGAARAAATHRKEFLPVPLPVHLVTQAAGPLAPVGEQGEEPEEDGEDDSARQLPVGARPAPPPHSATAIIPAPHIQEHGHSTSPPALDDMGPVVDIVDSAQLLNLTAAGGVGLGADYGRSSDTSLSMQLTSLCATYESLDGLFLASKGIVSNSALQNATYEGGAGGATDGARAEDLVHEGGVVSAVNAARARRRSGAGAVGDSGSVVSRAARAAKLRRSTSAPLGNAARSGGAAGRAAGTAVAAAPTQQAQAPTEVQHPPAGPSVPSPPTRSQLTLPDHLTARTTVRPAWSRMPGVPSPPDHSGYPGRLIAVRHVLEHEEALPPAFLGLQGVGERPDSPVPAPTIILAPADEGLNSNELSSVPPVAGGGSGARGASYLLTRAGHTADGAHAGLGSHHPPSFAPATMPPPSSLNLQCTLLSRLNASTSAAHFNGRAAGTLLPHSCPAGSPAPVLLSMPQEAGHAPLYGTSDTASMTSGQASDLPSLQLLRAVYRPSEVSPDLVVMGSRPATMHDPRGVTLAALRAGSTAPGVSSQPLYCSYPPAASGGGGVVRDGLFGGGAVGGGTGEGGTAASGPGEGSNGGIMRPPFGAPLASVYLTSQSAPRSAMGAGGMSGSGSAYHSGMSNVTGPQEASAAAAAGAHALARLQELLQQQGSRSRAPDASGAPASGSELANATLSAGTPAALTQWPSSLPSMNGVTHVHGAPGQHAAHGGMFIVPAGGRGGPAAAGLAAPRSSCSSTRRGEAQPSSSSSIPGQGGWPGNVQLPVGLPTVKATPPPPPPPQPSPLPAERQQEVDPGAVVLTPADEWEAANAALLAQKPAAAAAHRKTASTGPDPAVPVPAPHPSLPQLLQRMRAHSFPPAVEAEARAALKGPSRAPGFFSRLLCLAPSPLPASAVADKARILCWAKTAYSDGEDAAGLHADLLAASYCAFTGDAARPPRFGPHWARLGWQGDEPATDLRGCGVLGLLQLVTLYDHSPGSSRALYQLATSAEQEFPLAVVSLNATKHTLQAMREGRLDGAAMERGGMWAAAAAFHAGAMYTFARLWRDGRHTMKTSGLAMRQLEDRCRGGTAAVLAAAGAGFHS